MPPFPHSPIPHSSPAFTRSEFLVLLGLAVIVLSVVVAARWASAQRQAERRARYELRAVVLAADRYFSEYNTWPTGRMGAPGDVRYGMGLGNHEVLNVLRAIEGPGNPGHRLNPRRIHFLEVAGYEDQLPGLGGEGELRDPWGIPYQMVMDTDLDGYCSAADSIYRRVAGEGFIAWSCGPDRQSDTADDILSWRM
jgi:hypothetical protein